MAAIERDGVNIADGCSLVAAAALRQFHRPTVDMNNDDNKFGGQPSIWHSDETEPSPLPLHYTPLCITYAQIARDKDNASSGFVCALSDPTDRE